MGDNEDPVLLLLLPSLLVACIANPLPFRRSHAPHHPQFVTVLVFVVVAAVAAELLRLYCASRHSPAEILHASSFFFYEVCRQRASARLHRMRVLTAHALQT